MIEELLMNVVNAMSNCLDEEQLDKLQNVLYVNFHDVRVVEEKNELQATGTDSDTVKIGSDTDISCLEAEGEISDLSIIYDVPDAVKAPVSRWQTAGSMEIYSAGEYVCSKDLYYLEDIAAE